MKGLIKCIMKDDATVSNRVNLAYPQARSQDFLKGGSAWCMYACMHSCKTRGGWGHACSPRKFLEIRCSEVASEAILGTKQSRSCYIHGLQSITSNFWLSTYAFANPADNEFPLRKVYGWQIAGGVTDGEIVCREYVRGESSLYDSKMSIDYHNIP